MFRRLLSLDYVLDHPDLNWLPTEIRESRLLRPAWHRAMRTFRGGFGTTPPDTRCGSSPTSTPSPSIPCNKQAHFIYADSEEKSPQGVRSWRKEHAALWSDLLPPRLRPSISFIPASTPRLEESVSRVFSSWKNLPQSTLSSAEIEAELTLVHQAIDSNDDRALHEYGGFNGALRASAALKQRLQKQTTAVAYSASYSTWLSERIIQAVSNPNPSGSHSPTT